MLIPIDRDRALTGAGDGTARVWDTNTGMCLRVYPCDARISAATAVREGGPIVVLGLADGQVQFFRLENA